MISAADLNTMPPTTVQLPAYVLATAKDGYQVARPYWTTAARSDRSRRTTSAPLERYGCCKDWTSFA